MLLHKNTAVTPEGIPFLMEELTTLLAASWSTDRGTHRWGTRTGVMVNTLLPESPPGLVIEVQFFPPPAFAGYQVRLVADDAPASPHTATVSPRGHLLFRGVAAGRYHLQLKAVWEDALCPAVSTLIPVRLAAAGPSASSYRYQFRNTVGTLERIETFSPAEECFVQLLSSQENPPAEIAWASYSYQVQDEAGDSSGHVDDPIMLIIPLRWSPARQCAVGTVTIDRPLGYFTRSHSEHVHAVADLSANSPEIIAQSVHHAADDWTQDSWALLAQTLSQTNAKVAQEITDALHASGDGRQGLS